jgi:hypothetical protein
VIDGEVAAVLFGQLLDTNHLESCDRPKK